MGHVNDILLVCDQCGHRWIPESNKRPERCPRRACRTRLWDLGEQVERDNDRLRRDVKRKLERPGKLKCRVCGELCDRWGQGFQCKNCGTTYDEKGE